MAMEADRFRREGAVTLSVFFEGRAGPHLAPLPRIPARPLRMSCSCGCLTGRGAARRDGKHARAPDDANRHFLAGGRGHGPVAWRALRAREYCGPPP